MALKSKPPSTGTKLSGTTTSLSPAKGRRVAPIETIETRLERKATVADTKTFATNSLGQMTREQRHRLLYGD